MTRTRNFCNYVQTMLKLNSILRPEIKDLLTKCYPVVKSRPAIWFFMRDHGGAKDVKKIYERHFYDQWYALPPEKRMKYYDMAQFDSLRYREQRTLWIAEVGSILAKKGDNMQELIDSLQDVRMRQKELLAELEKSKGHYDKIIKLGSTRKYLKDVLIQTKNLQTKFSEEQLTTALPEACKPYLSIPQPPKNPFLMFRSERRDLLMRIKKENPHLTTNEIASREWNNLSQEERADYSARYDKLLEIYNEAMAIFKSKSGSHLEEAAKEKALFSRALRRRLREFDLVPVNPRNAFNFFIMEHNDKSMKHIGERVKVWKSLSDEEKEKYRVQAQQDIERYLKERKVYENFIQTLEKLFDAAKIKCADGIDFPKSDTYNSDPDESQRLPS